MEYKSLRVFSPEDAVLCIELRRTDAANALNRAMAEEISHVFQNLDSVRVVVLTGAGAHFCAGADLKERQGMDAAQWEEQHRHFRAARDAILHSPVPVIAAVNGAAYGGGLELALACDFLYAAEGAHFALPEVKLGIMPGLGGAQMLARAAGARRAAELLLTGGRFSAAEALAWGVASRVCAPGDLLPHAFATARHMRANAPLSVRAIRQALRQGDSLPLEEAIAQEMPLYHALVASDDRREGMAAFAEKRAPAFRGN